MIVRRRIPFKFGQASDEDATILDDQEQEALIEDLRNENTKSNKQSIVMMQILCLLSSVLHLIYLVDPTDDPLLILFPQHSKSSMDDTIPLPHPFTLVSLALHVNLLLLLDSISIRNVLLRIGIGLDDNADFRLYTLSPTLSYTLAFVAPAVCLFLRRSWWTVAWWSITALITFAVHSVLESIASGNEHITSLEAMRYTAPGA
ncbi:hypothetical protein GYMLUDRAFT_50148 [Collybiopsis luxurians FD-317 M1]|uniref:Uncharacterized protein n=1 Tax=Collybiopsis luxurians FD-317 M1 TaxID=944289 RepID=A0A0D0BCD0_9AGAR|nr:hypothetical protein GYMLUDRAFT_50148 [Collybiopsis luxurians FD-317 M1]